MKIFLILFLFLPSFNLIASLPEGAISLSQLQHGKIISLQGKKVEVQFTMVGCMDELGPVSYEFFYSKRARKFILLINAINIHTEMSTRVRCFVPKREKRIFTLPFPIHKRRIKLKFMKVLPEIEDFNGGATGS